jgi:hypothetical protein
LDSALTIAFGSLLIEALEDVDEVGHPVRLAMQLIIRMIRASLTNMVFFIILRLLSRYGLLFFLTGKIVSESSVRKVIPF